MKHLHYGWITVLIGACMLFTFSFLFFTFGVFIIPLTMEFNWDRGALSGVTSIFLLVTGGLGILTGKLSDKHDPRPLVTIFGLLTGTGFLLMSQINSLWQLYLIWALLMGIGGSCCYIPIMSTVPRWFAKKKGIAMGLTMTGAGLGGIISPSLTQWLISSYGWQQACVILGLIFLIIDIPLAQFMKHSPQWIGLRAYGENGAIEDKNPSASAAEGLSLIQAIKTGRWGIFGLIQFCWVFCLQVVMVHFVPYAIDIGIPAIVAASILSIISGISIIGRFSVGFVSDKIGCRLTLIACLAILLLALIWLLVAKETWMFYLFAVVFGFAYGSMMLMQATAPQELFGIKYLGMMMASGLLMGTIGGAVGSFLPGSIFDITGSYILALLMSVMVCALAMILSLIGLRYVWRTVY